MKSLVPFLIFFSSIVQAYTLSRNHEGLEVKWATQNIPVQIYHNADDLSATQTQQIINESLSQWNANSPIQMSESSLSRNTISFSSDPRYFGPGVIGVTLLSYEPSNGNITQGNILINQTSYGVDRFFYLSSLPNLSSTGLVYLGDVLSHEMGHLLGLSHSEVVDSTMVYANFKGQYEISNDEIGAIHELYNVSGRGQISGRVVGGNAKIFAAHVSAISVSTGEVVASVFSEDNGTFSIKGLAVDDAYYLYIEPPKDLDRLPSYLSSAQSDFCPGVYVGDFFEGCSSSAKGSPQIVYANTDVGDVTIRCSVRLADDYLEDKLIDQSVATRNFSSTQNIYHKSFVSKYDEEALSTSAFNYTNYDEFELDYTSYSGDSSDYLNLSLTSSQLGSTLDFRIEVAGPFGTQVFTSGVNPSTLKTIYDQSFGLALSSTPALNIFTVRIYAKRISPSELTSEFPSPELFTQDEYKFLFSAAVMNGGELVRDNNQQYDDNAQCKEAPLAYNVSANPVSPDDFGGGNQISTSPSSDQIEAAPSCGSVDLTKRESSQFFPLLFSLFLGLALSFAWKAKITLS